MTPAEQARRIEAVAREVMTEHIRPACIDEARDEAAKSVADLVRWHVEQMIRRPWRSRRIGPWLIEWRVSRDA